MLEAPLVSQLLFVGLLSINLAVLNVLPFPPLDGGRIAVVLIESVRRRKLPAEREALIYLTGFAVLIALVILISIQDIQRLITGGSGARTAALLRDRRLAPPGRVRAPGPGGRGAVRAHQLGPRSDAQPRVPAVIEVRHGRSPTVE